MTTTTRHAVLAGTCAAIPAAALSSVPAIAGSEIAYRVEALWRERAALVAESDDNMKALKAASARLPRWADSGPEHMDYEGNRCGGFSGGPEIENPNPAKNGPGAFARIRPTSSGYKRD